jgi:hypothetical protein
MQVWAAAIRQGQAAIAIIAEVVNLFNNKGSRL